MFTVTMLTNNCSMFAVCEMNLQILTNYFHVTIHVAAVQNCNRTFCSVFLREQDNMTLVTIWYIKWFSIFRIKQRIYLNISVGDEAFILIVLSIKKLNISSCLGFTKTISTYPKKIIQASIPFASTVWTVNFQFSYRSTCCFVVKDLILNKVCIIV